MSDATATTVKNRNSKVPTHMMLLAFKKCIANRDLMEPDNEDFDITPDIHEVTTFLNSHTIQSGATSKEDKFVPIPEGQPKGTRDHKAVYSRVYQIRKEIDEATETEIPQKIKDKLLNLLNLRDSVRQGTMEFRDVAIFLEFDVDAGGDLVMAPANMVPGSQYVGTNGQPVGQMVEA